MKHLKLLALSVCLLSLSACQTINDLASDLGLDEPLLSKSETPESEALVEGGHCPEARVVDELSMLSEFTNMQYPAPGDLISRARISRVEGQCEYGAKSVTVDLKLAFDGMLGPQGKMGGKPFYSYPYFVAVTSPGGDILAKEVFSASMTYQPGQDRQTYFESLRQIIPVPSENRGARYQVLVGFQLSPEQLAYNRSLLKQATQAKKEAAKAAEPPVVQPIWAPDSPGTP